MSYTARSAQRLELPGRFSKPIFTFFFSFVILAPLMLDGLKSSAGEGNPLRQITYLAVFGFAVLSSNTFQDPKKLLALPASIMLMLIWATVSMAWAINPDVGGRRLLLTMLIIFSIFMLVNDLGYGQTASAIRSILPLVLVANYLAILVAPDLSIHQRANEIDLSIVGAWRGILAQKNFAGAVCALTIVFFLFDGQSINWFKRAAILIGAAYSLYRTNSKTSAGVLCLSVAVGAVFGLYKPKYRLLTGFLLLVAIAAVALWVSENWAELIAPFARPDALTGRVQIWPVLLRYWRNHWLLGSGFGSFWNIGSSQPIYELDRGWISKITSGHNGYIDLLVQIGLPGLVLALLSTLIAPVARLLSSFSIDRSKGSLLMACIVFCVCHNMTESSIYDRDATVHVFLMTAIAMLARESWAPRKAS